MRRRQSTVVAALIPDVAEKGFDYGVPTAEVTKRCADILKCPVDEQVVIFDIHAILEPSGWVRYENGKAFLLPSEWREDRGCSTGVLQ